MASIIDIKEILNDYSLDIQEGISDAVIKVAKDGANKLKNTTNTYHVRTGKYNKGWSVTTKKGRWETTSVIHNKLYMLTHLLERGHNIVDRHGHKTGDARAFKHIAPVEATCIKDYEREVEQVIKNGG